MQVRTVAEQLFFVTVHITGRSAAGVSTGTGFVYGVETNRGTAHFVVTNKHVLDGCSDGMRIQMVAADSEGQPDFGRPAGAELMGVMASRTDHPDPDVDVAVLPFGGVVDGMRSAGAAPFFRAISDEQVLAADQQREVLDAVEEITFIGYPDNIFDTYNFTPVARTGITATPIALDFGGKPQFLIDAAVYPGSSGSPVFLLDRSGVYRSKNRATVAGFRFGLLGVLHAVRVRQVEADLVELPAGYGVRLPDPLNLGVVSRHRPSKIASPRCSSGAAYIGCRGGSRRAARKPRLTMP